MTAALSIPLTTMAGTAFPGRDLIVALSAGTILTTLIVHGIVSVFTERSGRWEAADMKHERQARLLIEAAGQCECARASGLPGAAMHVELDELAAGVRSRALLEEVRELGPSMQALVIQRKRRELDRLARAFAISEECRRAFEAELDIAELAVGR